MKKVLKSVKENLEFDLEEIDIETQEHLYELYKEKIPVLMINGKMFAKYRVEESKLINKLQS